MALKKFNLNNSFVFNGISFVPAQHKCGCSTCALVLQIREIIKRDTYFPFIFEKTNLSFHFFKEEAIASIRK
jgi:hypothetical protein